jgi:hypothetical protein
VGAWVGDWVGAGSGGLVQNPRAAAALRTCGAHAATPCSRLPTTAAVAEAAGMVQRATAGQAAEPIISGGCNVRSNRMLVTKYLAMTEITAAIIVLSIMIIAFPSNSSLGWLSTDRNVAAAPARHSVDGDASATMHGGKSASACTGSHARTQWHRCSAGARRPATHTGGRRAARKGSRPQRQGYAEPQ